VFGLYLLATVIGAVIGLATGNLLLIGRNGNLTVHGPAARAISAVILGFGAWIVWRVIRKPRARSVTI
jgi:ABC-type nickel/cobalt efflux system permease component RcnA